MAVTGAPSVERDLGLSHTGYAIATFVAPLILAAALEAAIALASDRIDRARLVVAGQAGLAASLAFVAWSTSAVGLSAGLALAGASSGVACGAAQAIVLRADARGGDRALLGWAAFAAAGDLLAPIVTGGAIALGYSYRGAVLAIAAVTALQCAALARATRSRPAANDEARDDEPPPDPLRVALARAIRAPRLWGWLFAAATCTLLDELVVALAALHVTRDRGAPEVWASVAAIAFAAGGLLGASLAERLVARSSSRAVLLASAALCAIALAATVLAPTAPAIALALVALGAACAPHHALALARAYDELPDRPGTVQALAQLFVAIDVVAPLALGVVADRFGLRAALASLALQPAIVAACAIALTPRSPAGRGPA